MNVGKIIEITSKKARHLTEAKVSNLRAAFKMMFQTQLLCNLQIHPSGVTCSIEM
jgi:hypothetical protein